MSYGQSQVILVRSQRILFAQIRYHPLAIAMFVRQTESKRMIKAMSLWLLVAPISNNRPDGHPSLTLEKPAGWIDNSNLDVIANLEKYDLQETELKDLINSYQGSLTTHIYMKYDPASYPGIIPTVQVNLRPNPNQEFNTFKTAIQHSMTAMANLLANFQVIQSLQELEIGGRKGVYFLASFDMKLPNGQIEKIRSWTYAIPVGNYFYQLNFSDLSDKDDCASTYARLVETIRID